MSIDALLIELEAMIPEFPESEGDVCATQLAIAYTAMKSIEAINKHMTGMVLVPIGWVEVATCPIADCVDGAHYDQYGEAEQCQFCYEKDEFITASQGAEK